MRLVKEAIVRARALVGRQPGKPKHEACQTPCVPEDSAADLLDSLAKTGANQGQQEQRCAPDKYYRKFADESPICKQEEDRRYIRSILLNLQERFQSLLAVPNSTPKQAAQEIAEIRSSLSLLEDVVHSPDKVTVAQRVKAIDMVVKSAHSIDDVMNKVHSQHERAALVLQATLAHFWTCWLENSCCLAPCDIKPQSYSFLGA